MWQNLILTGQSHDPILCSNGPVDQVQIHIIQFQFTANIQADHKQKKFTDQWAANPNLFLQNMCEWIKGLLSPHYLWYKKEMRFGYSCCRPTQHICFLGIEQFLGGSLKTNFSLPETGLKSRQNSSRVIVSNPQLGCHKDFFTFHQSSTESFHQSIT